jgi:hypothetical protein
MERVNRDADAIRARCGRLIEFVKEFWPVLEPNATFVNNWHIQAICEHLEAVTDGRINRLLITVPPGSMKSLELKALGDKARDLKGRKVQQLGEMVIATGADALSADELAGALIVLAETKEAGRREAWARRGAAFFQSRARRNAPTTERNADGAPAQPSGAQPASSRKGAT